MNVALYRKNQDQWKEWAKAQPKPSLLPLLRDQLAPPPPPPPPAEEKKAAVVPANEEAATNQAAAADATAATTAPPQKKKKKATKQDAIGSELDSILAKAK